MLFVRQELSELGQAGFHGFGAKVDAFVEAVEGAGGDVADVGLDEQVAVVFALFEELPLDDVDGLDYDVEDVGEGGDVAGGY